MYFYCILVINKKSPTHVGDFFDNNNTIVISNVSRSLDGIKNHIISSMKWLLNNKMKCGNYKNIGNLYYLECVELRRDIKLGTWNVRSLYRADSLKAAARELARYKLDVVGVQEVRWDKEGTVRAGDYNFFYGKENEKHQLGTGFYVHHRLVSAVKRIEFVSDRSMYLLLVRKKVRSWKIVFMRN